MMNSIQGFGPMQRFDQMQGSQTLTEDQQQQVEDILSKYDPENLTSDDVKEIFDAFREAGIRPGKGLSEAIEAAGFDDDEIRSLMPPPPPPPQQGESSSKSSGINVSALESLQSILSQYNLSSLTSEQQQSLLTQLNEAGLLNSGHMIDLSA
jgi:hypothetical protein